MLNTPLNIAKYCQQKRTGKLLIRASDLPDIAECEHDFELQYEFLLENKHYVVQLELHGALVLRCQSCWVKYELPVEVESRLVLTSDTSEQTHDELTALGYEIIIIEDGNYTTLLEIIKEEIFLQIPHIPRCPLHSSDSQGIKLVIDETGALSQDILTDEKKEQNNQLNPPSKNMPFQNLLQSLTKK